MNKKLNISNTGGGKRWHFNPATFALTFAGVVGMLGMATTAQADALYRTGFENPPFVNGGLLLGIDGWSTAIPPFLNPDAVTITNTIAKSGRQSVVVVGADLIGSEGITAPYDAVGSYRYPVSYTTTPTSSVARVDADLRIETRKPKTNGEFFSLTLSTRSGDNEVLGEIGLTSAGKVQAWDFGAAPGSDPKFSTSIRFNKWYRLTMLHDFIRHTTTYYIDEHRLGRISTPSTSNILLRSAMAVYARPDNAAPDLGSFRADYAARFDNFRISVHRKAPEID